MCVHCDGGNVDRGRQRQWGEGACVARRGSRMEDRQSNLINKMWTFGTVDCTDGGQYEMFVRAIYFSE